MRFHDVRPFIYLFIIIIIIYLFSGGKHGVKSTHDLDFILLPC